MRRFHRKDRKVQQAAPLPRLWLFTDPRIPEARLLEALTDLPRGSGLVFRHYELEPTERRALFERVEKIARRRGLWLLFGDAGDGLTPGPRRIDGLHVPRWRRRGHRPARPAPGMLLSLSAHAGRDIIAARRAGANLLFLSPVFATRSHPGAHSLGPLRFGLLARGAGTTVIALGGMNRKRFQQLRPLGAQGWAAIDALSHQRTG